MSLVFCSFQGIDEYDMFVFVNYGHSMGLKGWLSRMFIAWWFVNYNLLDNESICSFHLSFY